MVLEFSNKPYEIIMFLDAYALILLSAAFTLRASRSYSICFVAGHLRWRTTASYPAPRICCNLDSWI